MWSRALASSKLLFELAMFSVTLAVGHDRLLVCVNSATGVKRLARETVITIAFNKAVFVR